VACSLAGGVETSSPRSLLDSEHLVLSRSPIRSACWRIPDAPQRPVHPEPRQLGAAFLRPHATLPPSMALGGRAVAQQC
jgi:hypothetical protein